MAVLPVTELAMARDGAGSLSTFVIEAVNACADALDV